MLRFLLVSSLLALAACASPPSPTSGFRAIEIREGACFGTCPVYTLRMTPDDRYTLQAERFTRADGRSEGRLETGRFARIAEYIAANDLMAFPADITPGNVAACGDQIVSDMPDFQLTVRLAEREKVIHWYPGCFASTYRDEMQAARDVFRDAIGYEERIAR